jgi:hypothetical protein
MSEQTRAKTQAFKDKVAAIRLKRINARQQNPVGVGQPPLVSPQPMGGPTQGRADFSDVVKAPPLPLPNTQGRANFSDVRMAPPLPPNFQGDTRVPNVNTIGAPMPLANNTGTPATNTTSGTPNIGAGTPANFYNTPTTPPPPGAVYKKGGAVRAKKMASGGMTSKAPTASKRGDGIAQRGKTKGRMV